MVEGQPLLHIIYLKDEMLLSKKQYRSWWEIQEEFPAYKTFLGPMSITDVIFFFQDDYGDDDRTWPFSRKTIHDFAASNALTISNW